MRKRSTVGAALLGAALVLVVVLGVALGTSRAEPSDDLSWYASGSLWSLTLWATRDGRAVQAWTYELGRSAAVPPAGDVEQAHEVDGTPFVFTTAAPDPAPPGTARPVPPAAGIHALGGLAWDADRGAFVAASQGEVTVWIFDAGRLVRALQTRERWDFPDAPVAAEPAPAQPAGDALPGEGALPAPPGAEEASERRLETVEFLPAPEGAVLGVSEAPCEPCA